VTGPVAVGVDVGGTHLRTAVVGPDGLRGEVRRDRSRTDDGATLVADLAAAAAAVDPSGALPLGLGMAGLVAPDGHFLYGPNVGVADLPLATLVAAATGRRVTVLNDATAAVLGHVIVEDGGREAPSGIRGTLEGYASGEAVARAAAAAAARGVPGARSLDAVGVVAAAAAGEEWAVALLGDAGRWLGVALATLVNVLDPDVVVVGGGFGTAAAPWVLPAATAALAARVLGGDRRVVPPVRVAALGDDAGLLGAGLAALDAAP